MPPPGLTDNERAELIRVLRQIVEYDRFPLSPRVKALRSILEKLEPPAPKPEPLPPMRPPGEPTLAQQRKRRSRRKSGPRHGGHGSRPKGFEKECLCRSNGAIFQSRTVTAGLDLDQPRRSIEPISG
jgi:hypothetical protein